MFWRLFLLYNTEWSAIKEGGIFKHLLWSIPCSIAFYTFFSKISNNHFNGIKRILVFQPTEWLMFFHLLKALLCISKRTIFRFWLYSIIEIINIKCWIIVIPPKWYIVCNAFALYRLSFTVCLYNRQQFICFFSCHNLNLLKV